MYLKFFHLKIISPSSVPQLGEFYQPLITVSNKTEKLNNELFCKYNAK